MAPSAEGSGGVDKPAHKSGSDLHRYGSSARSGRKENDEQQETPGRDRERSSLSSKRPHLMSSRMSKSPPRSCSHSPQSSGGSRHSAEPYRHHSSGEAYDKQHSRNHERSAGAKDIRDKKLSRREPNRYARNGGEYPGRGDDDRIDPECATRTDGKSKDKLHYTCRNLPDSLVAKWYGRPEFVEPLAEELKALRAETKKLAAEECEINSSISKVRFEISSLDRDIENYTNERKVLSDKLKEIDKSLSSATLSA